jgi:NAD(P)-dependent dehydrogenase (short-subunit alcohol dehydrogenase family)
VDDRLRRPLGRPLVLDVALVKLGGKIVVVTGGGNGIGRALCRRFAAEKAKAIVVADVNLAAARQVADEIGGTAHLTDDGDRGIIVSALCPQGVRTDMLRRAEAEATRRSFLLDSALEPEQVAEDVVKGLEAERFLILPHGEAAEYVRRRATDHDRWLRGMRRLASNI